MADENFALHQNNKLHKKIYYNGKLVTILCGFHCICDTINAALVNIKETSKIQTCLSNLI